MNVNVLQGILLAVLSIAVVVLVVYLIQVLRQLKTTLKSVDTLTQQVNTEVVKIDAAVENIKVSSDHLKNVTGKVAGFSLVKGLGLLSGIIKGISFLKNVRAKKAKKDL